MPNKPQNERIARLQGRIAVASFAAGVIIACICLFLIPPPGEITSSAISIVSELLILAGALLGVELAINTKLQKFMTQVKAMNKHNSDDSDDDE